MAATEPDPGQAEDLIARLAGHGIRYFHDSPAHPTSAAVPLAVLLEDLARAPGSRLRSALVALLLRHPEYASVAEAAARRLPADDPARQLLLLSIVVAAALYREWTFSLDLYLPHQMPVQAGHLAAELGLPSPYEDYGRPCLAAAARLLRRDAVFPFNYEDDWENAVRRLLAQLVGEARTRGA